MLQSLTFLINWSEKGLIFKYIGQTTAAGYTAGYDQSAAAAAAAKPATYATTYTQRPGQQPTQVAVSQFLYIPFSSNIVIYAILFLLRKNNFC